MHKLIVTGMALLLIGTVSYAQKSPAHTAAQNRGELEKERAALQKEIAAVKRSLNETHQHRRESLAQLSLLQHTLSLRESAIRNTNAQVHLIRNTMNESGQESLQLQRRLDSLRSRYAEDIVSAYKDRGRYDYLSFIFSASSFNDVLIRIQYLRAYKASCAGQAAHMREEEQYLQNKINELKAAQLEKEAVLKKENKERMALGAEKLSALFRMNLLWMEDIYC